MATHDDNPQHDSREGAPVYRGADEPDAGASQPDRHDDAFGQDSTAAHDNREDDQIYQQAPAAGTGGAVDRPVDPAATHQARVGRVDNRVDAHLGDVSTNKLQPLPYARHKAIIARVKV